MKVEHERLVLIRKMLNESDADDNVELFPIIQVTDVAYFMRFLEKCVLR